ncbi:MAG: potassium channel family protein [Coriobacteriia bacterium]|nr:potassium channel family protein [Coriobacteriia bacterium]
MSEPTASTSDSRSLQARIQEPQLDRYALVCALILSTILSTSVLGDGEIGLILTLALMTTTLVIALRTSDAGPRVTLAATAISVLAIVGICVALLTHNTGPARLAYGLAMIGIVGVTPVVIARRLATHTVVSLDTVIGAAAIYLLIGLLFAVIYSTISFVLARQGIPAAAPGFFVASRPIEASDYVYYSFTTLATVGYGDLTASIALGRLLSVCEALIGQLYLVTIVAVLVSNMGRSRPRRADGSIISPTEED